MVDIDYTQMLNGDILIGRRFTGDTSEWMLLDGGQASHAAIILSEEGSDARYVADCPIDLGFYHNRGSVRIMELHDWLSENLA